MAASVPGGQDAYARREWGQAYSQLREADRETPLEPADLERLATAAYLTGRDSEQRETLERAHRAFLQRGEEERAARSAFWLGFALMGAGEPAQANGWISRAERLLNEAESSCSVRGFLLLMRAGPSLESGDAETAFAMAGEAISIGERCADRDLIALARLCRGIALSQMGDVDAGIALLDEVMVTVTSDDVSPIMVGTIYCAVIEACHQMFDLRRAQEWTAALSRWCSSQPDLVPYRGQCLVRRAQIMQMHGAWADALEEARRAGEGLDPKTSPVTLGSSCYRQAELHRLQGDYERAEAGYRQAAECGRSPHPGLALLRLQQGNRDGAAAGIQVALDEDADGPNRPSLLAAAVEIHLAVRDVDSARAAASELERIAGDRGAPYLRALSAHASGSVQLAARDAKKALKQLRHAWRAWRELEAPYEAARVRALVARACLEMGDQDTAEMELDAAKQAFQQLGAPYDLASVQPPSANDASEPAGGLSARELEVLRLVATGKTNRAVADELFISEKTVARHLSNIYTKLDISSRAAATAYAYEHDLV